jgi:hypothetical protein
MATMSDFLTPVGATPFFSFYRRRSKREEFIAEFNHLIHHPEGLW